MAFVDLEKALDRVPGKVMWWDMRKLGGEESLMQLVQGITLICKAGFVLAWVSAMSFR